MASDSIIQNVWKMTFVVNANKIVKLLYVTDPLRSLESV